MIHFLSKIIPLFFLPIGIVTILLIIKLIWNPKGSLVVAILTIWIFGSGFVSQVLTKWVEHPWDKKKGLHEIPWVDGIVVLSGGNRIQNNSGEIFYEWNDPDRFYAGIDLFKAGKSPILIFTGGNSIFDRKKTTEGQLYLNDAIKLGIDKDSIYITPPVFNTYEEALAINDLFINRINKNSKHLKIILVTSAFHMQRAKRVFEKNGFNVYPFPVDFQASQPIKFNLDPYNYIPNSRSLKNSSKAIREFIARFIYK